MQSSLFPSFSMSYSWKLSEELAWNNLFVSTKKTAHLFFGGMGVFLACSETGPIKNVDFIGFFVFPVGHESDPETDLQVFLEFSASFPECCVFFPIEVCKKLDKRTKACSCRMNFNRFLLVHLDWSKKRMYVMNGIEVIWMKWCCLQKFGKSSDSLSSLLPDGTETFQKYPSPLRQDEPCSMEDYADDAAALLEAVMPERQNPKGNGGSLLGSWTLATDWWDMKKNPTQHVLLLGGFAVILRKNDKMQVWAIRFTAPIPREGQRVTATTCILCAPTDPPVLKKKRLYTTVV